MPVFARLRFAALALLTALGVAAVAGSSSSSAGAAGACTITTTGVPTAMWQSSTIREGLVTTPSDGSPQLYYHFSGGKAVKAEKGGSFSGLRNWNVRMVPASAGVFKLVFLLVSDNCSGTTKTIKVTIKQSPAQAAADEAARRLSYLPYGGSGSERLALGLWMAKAAVGVNPSNDAEIFGQLGVAVETYIRVYHAGWYNSSAGIIRLHATYQAAKVECADHSEPGSEQSIINCDPNKPSDVWAIWFIGANGLYEYDSDAWDDAKADYQSTYWKDVVHVATQGAWSVLGCTLAENFVGGAPSKAISHPALKFLLNGVSDKLGDAALPDCNGFAY